MKRKKYFNFNFFWFFSTIIVNSRLDSSIIGTSGNYLEIDIWLPEAKIGFEFQVFNNI